MNKNVAGLGNFYHPAACFFTVNISQFTEIAKPPNWGATPPLDNP
jgi:hypothetical protein